MLKKRKLSGCDIESDDLDESDQNEFNDENLKTPIIPVRGNLRRRGLRVRGGSFRARAVAAENTGWEKKSLVPLIPPFTEVPGPNFHVSNFP